MTSNQNFIYSPPLVSNLKFSPPLKLGVMASGNGTNFQALVMACQSHELQASIELLIVNNDNCGALTKAKDLGINYKVINHRNYTDRLTYDQDIVKEFRSANIEGIVMAGWMRIVTKELIRSYPYRIINIHPSILPSYKGINSIKRALDSGVKITGCTTHFLEEIVDSGPIIAQAAIPIYTTDNVNTLEDRLHKIEHKLLISSVNIAGLNWRN